MFRRRSRTSPQTYTWWAAIAAAIGLLDIIVGLGAIYAVIMFLLAAWSLRAAWRTRRPD